MILRNLHLTFDWHYIGKKHGEDFAKFCGLLRIYELYLEGAPNFETWPITITNIQNSTLTLLFDALSK